MQSYVVGRPELGDLVVVPGLCVSRYLRPAADALAERGYRVHLVDPPGWPYSEEPAEPPRDAGEIAQSLVRWLRLTGLARVTLVGQSFGAQLAAHVAAQAPDLVDVVVLQGPTFDPAYRTLPRALWRLLSDYPRERPSLLVVEAPEWLRVGLRQVLRMARIAVADRLEETVRRVTCPVLVLVGEHDTLAGLTWTSSLVAPDRVEERHVVLPGLPHSSPHADPQGFARALRSVLERVG